MADIIKWEMSKKDTWLKKASIIDVKKESELLETIVERLKYAFEQRPDLVYITANQVGYDKQVFGIRMSSGQIAYFANPIMMSSGKVVMSREKEVGLDHEYFMPRWTNLTVISYIINIKKVAERQYENELACLFQHILNNLDGISIADTGLIITEEYDKATPEEQNEVLALYLKELLELMGKLEDEIREDSELNEKFEAIKIAKAIASGEIAVEEKVPKPNRKTRRLIERIINKIKKKSGK